MTKASIKLFLALAAIVSVGLLAKYYQEPGDERPIRIVRPPRSVATEPLKIGQPYVDKRTLLDAEADTQAFPSLEDKMAFTQAAKGYAANIADAHRRAFGGEPRYDWAIRSDVRDGKGGTWGIVTQVRPNTGFGPKTVYLSMTISTKGEVVSMVVED